MGAKPKTPKLRDAAERAYLAFGRRLITDAIAWASSEGLTRVKRERLVFTDEGIGSEESESLFVWKLLKNHYGDEVWGTPEAEQCAKIHLLRGIIQPPQLSRSDGTRIVDPTFDQMRSFVIIELLRPLVSGFERHDTLELSDPQILAAYRAPRETWTAKKFSHQLVIPIAGLQSDVDMARVGEHLELSPFSNDEKSEAWWFGTLPAYRSPDAWAMHGTEYKLVARKELARGATFPEVDISNDAKTFLLALRLRKAGQVGILGTFGGVPGQMASSYGWPSSELRIGDATSRYSLPEGDLPGVLSLFTSLKAGIQGGQLRSLDTAFRRFNMSYGRELEEDRLIDLTISLESSVLVDTDRELGYRLAMRGAKLLADVASPGDTKALLDLLYHARSQIVHNGKPLVKLLRQQRFRALKPSLGGPADFVDRCADVTRNVLRHCTTLLLTREQSLRDLIKTLDSEIVDSLQQSKK